MNAALYIVGNLALNADRPSDCDLRRATALSETWCGVCANRPDPNAGFARLGQQGKGCAYDSLVIDGALPGGGGGA
jgi:hypothetical protein